VRFQQNKALGDRKARRGTDPELVDLVNHDDRIGRFAEPERVDDLTRERPNVRPAVALYLCRSRQSEAEISRERENIQRHERNNFAFVMTKE
jgi:hypothetical protein